MNQLQIFQDFHRFSPFVRYRSALAAIPFARLTSTTGVRDDRNKISFGTLSLSSIALSDAWETERVSQSADGRNEIAQALQTLALNSGAIPRNWLMHEL